MIPHQLLLPLLTLTISLSACAPASGIQTQPQPASASETVLPAPATSAPQLPTAPVPAPALSLADFKNAEIHAPQYDKTVQLTDGKYEAGSGADYLLVQLLDQGAIGDLNGDGQPDAALLLAENGGGSGVFVSVVVMLNQDGQIVQAGAVLIDDRPKINSLTIQDGQINIDAVIHGINDPLANPTFAVTKTYQLAGDGLQLTRLTSQTAAGKDKIISISSPAEGSEISGPFTLKGSVTVAPFENSLVYAVSAEGAPEPFVQAGFTIQAETLGGPGAFELPLDFTAAGLQGPVRIQISDFSAADGSWLAVATLHLVLK
jgi:hypothetical protein